MTIFGQTDPDLLFPDSDGKPMAENTEHYRWIVLIKENLEILFANNDRVFIAGDLLWYPIRSQLVAPTAPDVMVIFGRPKGRRGSYRQWQAPSHILQQAIINRGYTGKTHLRGFQIFFKNIGGEIV